MTKCWTGPKLEEITEDSSNVVLYMESVFERVENIVVFETYPTKDNESPRSFLSKGNTVEKVASNQSFSDNVFKSILSEISLSFQFFLFLYLDFPVVKMTSLFTKYM